MESSTRCALASVSKQFTSAAAYLLQQRGKLSLDKPLATYVPTYVLGPQMTLRQALTMRSGMTSNDEACEGPIDGKIDDGTLIANLNKRKLDFPPGRYFAYSNCAYDMVGAAVANVAQMSYKRFIEENFFRPLGMTSSYVLRSRSDANFAQGYAPQGNGWKAEPASAADAAFASGNLVSTVGDVQRWNRSLLNHTILTPQTLDEIFKVPTTSGSAHMHYASGWFVEPSGLAWHGGTLAGYGTLNMLIRSTGHAITLLSNTPAQKTWKPEEVGRAMYNAAALGPALPPFLKRARTTASQ